jgi:hypothetical protein
MKAASILTAIALLAISSSYVQAGDVNVGVSISGEIQPGVYGQVNISNTPNYALVYPQPIVIAAPHAYGVPVHAVYMHVPPGHAKHWSKHCQKYNACGRPVYFVKSAEYDPGYDSHHSYHGEHDHHDGHGKGKGNGKGKNKHKQ